MFVRVAPVFSLALTAAGLGCPHVPAPLTEANAVARASVDAGEDEVLASGADAGQRIAAHAPSLFEQEAIPRDVGDVTDHRNRGKELLEDKRAREAVDALRVALSTDASAEVWYLLGEAYLLNGETRRGVACLEEALQRDPAFTPARRALVKSALSRNDGDTALRHADELVRQAPLDPSVRQLLGRAQMQKRMWDEAIASFTLVVEANPDNIFAHNNIGYSALQLGQLTRARDHLERCLGLEPQQGYMLNNLGVAYERLGQDAEAHAAYSRAAELSPRYAQAALNRDRIAHGLTEQKRVSSLQTLAWLRDPGAVTLRSDVVDAGELPVDTDRAAVRAAEAALSAGGSARLAPAP